MICEVKVTKITGADLMRLACSYTISAESEMTLDKIYQCEHSPMRTQMFVVEMKDIPTFVSVHFVRHKHGVEHFVKSNREDRASHTGDSGRWHPVNHMMLCNAQSLVNLARKRLCRKASKRERNTARLRRTSALRFCASFRERGERINCDCTYQRSAIRSRGTGSMARRIARLLRGPRCIPTNYH